LKNKIKKVSTNRDAPHMAKTLIAMFVTASAGHIPSTATNTGFYFQSSSDSLHEKGGRICKPTK
jgi:hypothetical protein